GALPITRAEEAAARPPNAPVPPAPRPPEGRAVACRALARTPSSPAAPRAMPSRRALLLLGGLHHENVHAAFGDVAPGDFDLGGDDVLQRLVRLLVRMVGNE